MKKKTFCLSDISFAAFVKANHDNELSITDWICQSTVTFINISLILAGPYLACKFSKVFTNFFEKTAKIGRKVTTEGLITKACSDKLSKKAMKGYFIKSVLVCLGTLFFIIFQYLWLVQLDASLKVDHGLCYQLLFISIPFTMIMVYPSSIVFLESTTAHCCLFSKFAVEKWGRDFKKDLKSIKSQIIHGNTDNGPVALQKCKCGF